MNSLPLDPWDDAAAIAARLSMPGSKLVIMLGAESWCQICRDWRPLFDAVSQQNEDSNQTWLWLDLEDHAEFMDDFIPDGLPLLMSYEEQRLTHAVVPDKINQETLMALLALPSCLEQSPLPDIHSRLVSPDWA